MFDDFIKAVLYFAPGLIALSFIAPVLNGEYDNHKKLYAWIAIIAYVIYVIVLKKHGY